MTAHGFALVLPKLSLSEKEFKYIRTTILFCKKDVEPTDPAVNCICAWLVSVKTGTVSPTHLDLPKYVHTTYSQCM